MSIAGIGGIDTSRIQAMMEQLKAAAAKPTAAVAEVADSGATPASTVSFSDALKASLQSVSNAQTTSEDMGKKFAVGDDSVSLSDTMIAMQKANIGFQATVQVRNKLVAAYHEIMNMQV